MIRKRKPVHPGNILKEDVLLPLGLTVTEAAADLGVSRKALSELINERAALSPDMAIRIAKATNTSPESWLNMQTTLDLWKSEQKVFQVIPFPTHTEPLHNIQEG
jgi:addiction module HigA family antidote